MLKREYERQRCGCMSEKKELVLDDGRIESIQYQSPEQLYEDLILRVKKYHPSDDISLIETMDNTSFDTTSSYSTTTSD